MDEPHFTLIEALILIQVGLGGLKAAAIEYEDGSGLSFNMKHLETGQSFYIRLNKQGQIIDGCESTRTIAQMTGRMYRGIQNPLSDK